MVAYAEKNFVHHFITGEYWTEVYWGLLGFTEVHWNVITEDTEIY